MFNNNNNNNNNDNDRNQSTDSRMTNDTENCCGCFGNSNNNNSNNNSNNDSKKARWAKTIGIGVLMFISLGLLGASFRRVEETQFGLLYDVWTKELDMEAVSGGLFRGPPGFRFVKFPSTFVTTDLNYRYCVSGDGLIVGFSVTFQYQMIAEAMFPAVERYRDFTEWGRIVEEAGLSAIHHSCSDFVVSNFQNKRGEIQARMEENLKLKLEGNATSGEEGVYARAMSLQLRNIELPENYSNAVRLKQSAEEDIALAVNQRQQETTRAGTALLAAREEARKILDRASNDATILLKEASLEANQTTYAFEQEARTIADARRVLGLTADGVLAYLANGLLEDPTKPLVVSTGEPARLSRAQDLATGGGGP